MAYQRKYLGGWLPFWPTMRLGYYLGVLMWETPRVFAGQSGRMYLRQYCQEAHRAWRLWPVLAQLPMALVRAVADEARNIAHSRFNNRVV